MSNTLHDDIAYMKSLAEDGGRPVVNGTALFWAGLVFGGAAVVHYLCLAGFITVGNPWYQAAIWVGAGVVYGIVCAITLRGKGRETGPAAKAVNSVWAAIAVSVMVLLLCLTTAGARLETLEAQTALIAPAILILYGIGWWVAAVVSGQGWLKLVCAGCFVAAPLVAFLGGQAEQMLAYAACLGLFAIVPGFLLMRAAKG